MPWTTTTTRATGNLMTAAIWNAEVVDNMQYLEEVAYTEFTSNVSVTVTSEGTAVSVVSSGAITYENVPHMIEFFAPRVIPSTAAALRIVLFDSTTALGWIGNIDTTSASGYGQHLMRRVTPTAASHTYNIKAFLASAGTGTVSAGLGGAGTLAPGFIRIMRVPT